MYKAYNLYFYTLWHFNVPTIYIYLKYTQLPFDSSQTSYYTVTEKKMFTAYDCVHCFVKINIVPRLLLYWWFRIFLPHTRYQYLICITHYHLPQVYTVAMVTACDHEIGGPYIQQGHERESLKFYILSMWNSDDNF